MMRAEIRHIDVGSVVKVCFVIYAVLGLIVGVVYAFVAVLFGSLLNLDGALGGSNVLRFAASGLGILLIPVFVLFYGCLGAVAGAIVAAVYNLIARAFGGVRITLKGEEIASEVSGPGQQSDMRL
jgi:hypothetical protein